MRFLVDENLSPLLAMLLRDAGYDALHLRDLGMARDDDVKSWVVQGPMTAS